jgi:hypothetical protein
MATGFIYDYQTMITGVIAAVGAIATIRVMSWAKLKSQRRHIQAMKLDVRADKLGPNT